MSTLISKISRLKLNAYAAHRTITFWEQQIALHGEAKATEFYQHLGLNHVEMKQVDFDGLSLRRQPRASEAIAVKGVAQAQDSARDRLVTLLGKVRTALIDEGLREIVALKPANYHALILDTATDYRDDLQRQLIVTYNDARLLVARELGQVKSFKQDADDDFDELDDLVDVTLSRVTNDVQARITGAATRLAILGLTAAQFTATLGDEIRTGSVAYIDRTATGIANRTINIGRGDEMREHADDIDRYEQSALLDVNVCGPCSEDDGLTATNPDDLPGGPNPDCLGTDLCRCFVVAIVD